MPFHQAAEVAKLAAQSPQSCLLGADRIRPFAGSAHLQPRDGGGMEFNNPHPADLGLLNSHAALRQVDVTPSERGGGLGVAGRVFVHLFVANAGQ